MSRFNLLLSTILAVIVIAIIGALFLVKNLRQEARHRYYEEIANEQAEEITITIPEGYRREQIAATLEKQGVTAADDFLAATKNDEGRLFPDTYRFFHSTNASDVRNKFVDNYQAKIENIKLDTKSLIMASIIEREARNDEERAKIAGVYWNRFNAGFALTADPTVQYGKDTNQFEKELLQTKTKEGINNIIKDFNFWGVITRADYDNVESPYNTYRVAGLPPSPICNPGLASIKAALEPESHNYYYFFHTAEGETIYSRTLEEHNQNKTRFL